MRATMTLLGSTLLAFACGSKDKAAEPEVEVAVLHDEAPPEEEESESGGAHMRLDEGAAGKPGSERTDGHMKLEEGAMGKRDRISREEAIEAARTAGVLGSSGGYSSLTGSGDISSGFDDTSVYGGFGFGRSGFGPGGGGTGTSAGRYGTIGKGSGTGRAGASNTQFDGVKAGEWDDNANYRDYTKWLKETPRGIARLDISDRQFVVVRDKDGKPVPNCPVTLVGSEGRVTLLTSSAGRVLVFPKAYKLGTPRSASTLCAGSQVFEPLGGQIDSVTALTLDTARTLPAQRAIDLAFVVDTTGSMGEEIDAVKQTIRAVATQLANDQTSVRIGLVEYKDRTDSQLTQVFPFSSDLGKFSRSVAGLHAAGGGDTPEDMHAGVNAALDKLQWRSDAVARMVVVIADAPPHLDYQDPDYAAAAQRAAKSGIKLYTVAASGMDTTGQIVMRQMAQFTGATNLFVLRGGAGPQSAGGGDPKSSCGGTQEQYATGNLHGLVISKIKRELSALDADPMKIAGLGKDESSKPCHQRVAVR